MASITSAGLGSGLDITGLVTKLVAAEGDPATQRLNTQEAQFQARLSGLGTLKGALSDFQGTVQGLESLSAFQAVTATSSNTAVFTASAAATAGGGNHSIMVTRLAQGQKLASTAFTDTTSAVGTGVLTFQLGTFSGGVFTPNAAKATQTVTIGADDSSLQGIRDAVNKANIGVTASIVNDGTGNRLVFSSTDTGAANSIKLTVSDNDGNNLDNSGLSKLAYDPTAAPGAGKNLSESIAALDAQLTVDGLPITSASNTVTGAIEGVTLNLLSAPATGNSGTLTVATDKASMSSAVGKFVSKYNSLMKSISSLSGYDANTKQAGVLLGDSAVLSITSGLRRIIGGAVPGLSGQYTSLSQLGITTQSDGTLALDSTKLQAALDADPSAVARVFAAAGQPSDALVRYVSATSATKPGQYALNVTQFGTQGAYTGAAMAALPLTVDANNDTLALKVDGVQSGTISLTQESYATGADLATELQSRINGDSALKAAGVSVLVSYDSGNNRLNITSARYGSASKVEVTSADTNTAATLGSSVGVGTDGVDVAGTIGSVGATGSGRILTGTGDAAGLAVEIQGGTMGVRGTVTFSRGVADQLDSLLSGLLDSSGTLSSETDGVNTSIKDIDQQRDVLSARLAALQDRYTKQFNAMDALVGQMKATSNYLTQQLASLPGVNSSSSSSSQ